MCLPGADGPRDRLHLPVQAGFEIEDPEWRILILHFRHDVAPGGLGRDGVSEKGAGRAGYARQQLGVGHVAHVEHVVAAVPRAVKPILMRHRVIAHVEVMVATEEARRVGVFDGRDQPRFRVTRQELLHVVHVRVTPRRRREHQRPAVGMLVVVDVVETTGRIRSSYSAHFPDGHRVGEASDVHHHGAQVAVRTAPLKLTSLHRVVSALDLEILVLQTAGPLVELGVLDVPVVDHLGVRGIFDADDVESRARGGSVKARHVRAGARELLLDLDVPHREDPPQGDV